MRVPPRWLRVVSGIFGLATVPFLYVALLDAHTAATMGPDYYGYDELVLGVIKRVTYAVICLAIALLPVVWWMFPRHFDTPVGTNATPADASSR